MAMIFLALLRRKLTKVGQASFVCFGFFGFWDFFFSFPFLFCFVS